MRPHATLFDVAAGRPLSTAVTHDIVDSAVEHRMAGFLWRAVREQQADQLAHAQLARHFVAQAARSRELASVLSSTVAKLEHAGLRVAACKGVALEAQLYGEAGIRHTNDIDLVLHPADVHRVMEVVALLAPADPHVRKQATMALQGILPAVTMTVDEVEIDLHVSVLKAGRPLDPFGIWARMQPVQIPQCVPLLAPCPELAFVHGLVNMSRDRFRWLQFEADVAAATALPGFDWDTVRQIVDDERLDGIIPPAWHAVTQDLGIVDNRRLGRPPALRATIWGSTFPTRARLRGDDVVVTWRHKSLGLSAARSGRDALRALRARYLPSRLWIEFWYPGRGPWWWPWIKRVVAVRRQRLARVRRSVVRRDRSAREAEHTRSARGSAPPRRA